MTIIVASATERLMCADTAIVDTDRNLIIGYEVKIIKTAEGLLAGASGDAAAGALILDWLATGQKRAPRPSWFREASLLVMFPSGQILIYEGSHLPERSARSYAAIGHGAPIAAGVLSIGGSALDAVRAASNVSCYCGGEPTILRLES